MSNELALPMGNKMEYAQTLSQSGLLPKHFQNNPANLLFAIEFAEALGMKPIHAITSVHVINGKPSASADLIATMVRRAGHKLRITGDDTYAEAVLIRKDDPDFEFRARWDMAKARQASLNTPTWKNYPGAMLRSRAITEVCRAGASDAMHGIQYSTEELESLGTATSAAPSALHLLQDETVDLVTGEVQDLGEQRDWAAEIAAADIDGLKALWGQAPQNLQADIETRAAQLKEEQ